MPFSKAVGGLELDFLSISLISEEMGWAAADLAVSLAVSVTPFAYAQLSPDPEVRRLTRKFYEDTEAAMIGCWAITEPDHGSDWILLASEQGRDPKLVPQVRALADGDHYILSGQKSSWGSNGTIATHAAVWVSLDPSKGMEGGGITVVPLHLPGVSRGKPLNKLGQRALNQGEIFFDRVRVPKSMMIAQEPMSFKFMSMLNWPWPTG